MSKHEWVVAVGSQFSKFIIIAAVGGALLALSTMAQAQIIRQSRFERSRQLNNRLVPLTHGGQTPVTFVRGRGS